jgi:hypothetical protein
MLDDAKEINLDSLPSEVHRELLKYVEEQSISWHRGTAIPYHILPKDEFDEFCENDIVGKWLLENGADYDQTIYIMYD